MADFDRLVDEARRARARAVAPYSRFQVGAALSTPDGRVYGGGNVESAAYGLTMCAERVALFRALADGARAFDGLAVVADTVEPTPPCGACRQLLWEYGGDLPVLLADLSTVRERLQLADLFPRPFDRRLLG